jgi:hypothetical protein
MWSPVLRRGTLVDVGTASVEQPKQVPALIVTSAARSTTAQVGAGELSTVSTGLCG